MHRGVCDLWNELDDVGGQFALEALRTVDREVPWMQVPLWKKDTSRARRIISIESGWPQDHASLPCYEQ